MTTAETKIRKLAKQHGVTFTPTAEDAWAVQVKKLADAGVDSDPVADLVIALRRVGVLSATQATVLYIDHLSSR